MGSVWEVVHSKSPQCTFCSVSGRSRSCDGDGTSFRSGKCQNCSGTGRARIEKVFTVVLEKLGPGEQVAKVLNLTGDEVASVLEGIHDLPIKIIDVKRAVKSRDSECT